VQKPAKGARTETVRYGIAPSAATSDQARMIVEIEAT
jgi:hypothetical protein